MSEEGSARGDDTSAAWAASAGLRAAAVVSLGLAATFLMLAMRAVWSESSRGSGHSGLDWWLALAWTVVGVVLARLGKRAVERGVESFAVSASLLLSFMTLVLVLIGLVAAFFWVFG
ncbi:hypothetical protein [Segniliparus rugosus]|uniref:Uncharacterized protein n=1 Tax=Segniliparus rugosus (strain ATCC BAA-974 / DSM 45345 / CCUG 50838 / CIP 108380 / JCM 13579 / CDC 945) TaxID=679197 RepID=E5XLI0_SEGRC|nr:hypothetical protein [Segniliparus rugosus]EFV14794.1 hypothetical protein HMPREF9336_00349 [Segniliparus rugosus ATCC BAA-974]